MTAESARHEGRAPYVPVLERRHWNGAPLGAVEGGMQQRACNALVTLDDHVGFDVDRFAQNALQRRSTAVDGGTYLLDDCPAPSVLWQFHAEFVDNVDDG